MAAPFLTTRRNIAAMFAGMSGDMLVTILGILLGIFGLIASIFGSILAYFAYIDPRKRLNKYFDKIERWENISVSIKKERMIWRYKDHPEFVIEVKDDIKTWDPGAVEPWMKMPLPDPGKTMYMVHVTVGGVILYAEKFISLDGWRYFIPLPRVKSRDGGTLSYEYDEVQIKLARIIGSFHYEKTIDDLAERCGIILKIDSEKLKNTTIKT